MDRGKGAERVGHAGNVLFSAALPVFSGTDLINQISPSFYKTHEIFIAGMQAASVLAVCVGATTSFLQYATATIQRGQAVNLAPLTDRMFHRAASTLATGAAIGFSLLIPDFALRSSVPIGPAILVPTLATLGTGILAFDQARRAKNGTTELRRRH